MTPCGHPPDAPPVPGCVFCRVRDVPAVRAAWAGRPAPPSRFRLDCTHRGPRVRQLSAGCGACSVFACRVFGECLVVARPDGVGLADCQNCNRYEAPPAA